MRTGKRRIRRGIEYERFFKPAKGKTIIVKKQAQLEDTLNSIKYVIEKTLDQTEKIAEFLKAENVRQTCRQIWEFCFHHFQYEKDEKRKEQIRTPSRAWYDRGNIRGIDCDCFTTLIGSILTNLEIPFVMRLARYEGEDFEHIYPVAYDENGNEIIIDAVLYEFDSEYPIPPQGQLKDVEMELQILNGVENRLYSNDLPIDAEDLFLNEDMELDGLEGKAEREARRARRRAKKAIPKSERKATRKAKRKEAIAKFKSGSLKDKIRTGFNVLNKANPAAMLLRGGILASMKLNLFKVASRLRFAYWSQDQARANNMEMGKFNQLQRIREKVEKIYYRAGGKPSSLKKAMLTGKGNRNKMVSLNGLGSVIDLSADEADLRTILGDELYYGELDGLDGLGEPATIATGAAITAASGAMGIIAGLIKKLGGLFKKGSRAAQKFKIQDNGDNVEEKKRKFSFKNIANKVRNKIQERKAEKARKSGIAEDEAITFEDDEQFDIPEEEYQIIPEDDYTPDLFIDNDADGSENNTTDTNDDEKPSTKGDGKAEGGLKNWINENKPLAITLGVVGVSALVGGTILVVKAVKKSKAKKTKAKNPNSVNGVPKSKKRVSKVKKPTPRKTTTRRKAPIKKLREIELK